MSIPLGDREINQHGLHRNDYESLPPQTHCLRICAYIVKRAINPRENMSRKASCFSYPDMNSYLL